MTLLTIREAADRTGHSTHKIRRLIKAIADHPEHPDRGLIEPTPADVDRLTAEQVQFTWRISEELVLRMLGASPATTPARSDAVVGESSSGDAVALLQRALAAQEGITDQLIQQLKVKDSQIEGMQQFMHSLNERLRESNVLMASLQKQLPAPTEKGSDVSASKTSPSATARKGKAAGTTKSVPRRSWLAKMFR